MAVRVSTFIFSSVRVQIAQFHASPICPYSAGVLSPVNVSELGMPNSRGLPTLRIHCWYVVGANFPIIVNRMWILECFCSDTRFAHQGLQLSLGHYIGVVLSSMCVVCQSRPPFSVRINISQLRMFRTIVYICVSFSVFLFIFIILLSFAIYCVSIWRIS